MSSAGGHAVAAHYRTAIRSGEVAHAPRRDTHTAVPVDQSRTNAHLCTSSLSLPPLDRAATAAASLFFPLPRSAPACIQRSSAVFLLYTYNIYIYIYIYIDARRVPAVLPPSLLFSPVSLALLGQSRAEPPPPSFFAPPTERAAARDTREWERDRYISI